MYNRNNGVMVNIFVSSVVDRRFEPKTIDWYLLLKHTALRSKSKDWLAQNKENVFEWNSMSTRGLLFQ